MLIKIEGETASQDTPDLLRWLRQEEIQGIRFEQKRATPLPDEMGGDLLPVISAMAPVVTAVVGSPVLVEIIKSIGSWFNSRKSKAKVVITRSDGYHISIDVDNYKDIQFLLNDIIGKK
ncbi:MULTISPECIES: hypothetical protein [Methylobacterium]|uniref:effector-associated constant component EACC1 n=1 Tax=Methylobacterium TaxID=407 RepID=UPI001114052C|nr:MULTISPECIES: hypothetical protein [Methylobacterium]MBK3398935.1 hypothetical protein [Methylobacterium ajmalii]MBK3408156.1 hypothetical protein [Methylobacterium ajmalii]MBK3426592.1 hypothetical protein [Methylobacterium ajmalii]MBZ6414295.1 hypothetical protein [Methylobacterium sp.]